MADYIDASGKRTYYPSNPQPSAFEKGISDFGTGVKKAIGDIKNAIPTWDGFTRGVVNTAKDIYNGIYKSSGDLNKLAQSPYYRYTNTDTKSNTNFSPGPGVLPFIQNSLDTKNELKFGAPVYKGTQFAPPPTNNPPPREDPTRRTGAGAGAGAVSGVTEKLIQDLIKQAGTYKYGGDRMAALERIAALSTDRDLKNTMGTENIAKSGYYGRMTNEPTQYLTPPNNQSRFYIPGKGIVLGPDTINTPDAVVGNNTSDAFTAALRASLLNSSRSAVTQNILNDKR